MRIARVIMVCVALISTLFSVRTELSRRRSQPKDHLPEPRPEDDSTTPVTFTTHRPVATFIGHQIDRDVHPASIRRIPRIRASRFALIKIRESNSPKNNRRRRQLLRRGKKNHLGRSFDLHDAQKPETVHGSPETKEVHLEPIYRVTKNKNIFDSIIDLIRRIIGTEQTVGPLVGPFKFPGLGDKVYVRLLEPVPPDHLTIRLITHAPGREAAKEISVPIERPKHPEIPSSVSHESVVVHSDDLTSSFGKSNEILSVESDSLLSPSNNFMQTLKPSERLGQKVVANGPVNGIHVSRSYGMNEQLNSTNHPLNWKFVDRFNDSRKDQGVNGYQDSFNRMYRFYPPLNETNQDDFGALNVDVQEFPRSLNVSDFRQEIGPIIPYRDYGLEDQHEFRNEYTRANEAPKYSLDFVSEKMRYLNMDGSVDSSREDEGFKPIERDPVLPKMIRSVDNRKRVVRKMLVKRKEVSKDEKSVRGKNDGGEEFPETEKKSNDDRFNYSRNVTTLNENGNSTDLRGI